jgi:hypothetical protein
MTKDSEESKPEERQERKPNISEQAGTIILALLEAHPDGLSRAEMIELKGDAIPRNKRGHYVAEGIAWIRGQGRNVTRAGGKYKLGD